MAVKLYFPTMKFYFEILRFLLVALFSYHVQRRALGKDEAQVLQWVKERLS